MKDKNPEDYPFMLLRTFLNWRIEHVENFRLFSKPKNIPVKGVIMKLSLAGQSFELADPSVSAPKLQIKLWDKLFKLKGI